MTVSTDNNLPAEEAVGVEVDDTGAKVAVLPVKRGRGRPRKHPLPAAGAAVVALVGEPAVKPPPVVKPSAPLVPASLSLRQRRHG